MDEPASMVVKSPALGQRQRLVILTTSILLVLLVALLRDVEGLLVDPANRPCDLYQCTPSFAARRRWMGPPPNSRQQQQKHTTPAVARQKATISVARRTLVSTSSLHESRRNDDCEGNNNSSSRSSSRSSSNRSWFENLIPNFLQKRQGDFVRLEESADVVFGPGPMILLYNVPSSIENEEFHDMIADGVAAAAVPRTKQQHQSPAGQWVHLHRIECSTTTTTTTPSLLALPVAKALQQILDDPSLPPTIHLTEPAVVAAAQQSSASMTTTTTTTTNGVLYFSGFANSEMMAVYQIMAAEIYQESGGRNNVACAKAVPNAMDKPLGQVLEEICGDHQQAIMLST